MMWVVIRRRMEKKKNRDRDSKGTSWGKEKETQGKKKHQKKGPTVSPQASLRTVQQAEQSQAPPGSLRTAGARVPGRGLGPPSSRGGSASPPPKPPQYSLNPSTDWVVPEVGKQTKPCYLLCSANPLGQPDRSSHTRYRRTLACWKTELLLWYKAPWVGRWVGTCLPWFSRGFYGGKVRLCSGTRRRGRWLRGYWTRGELGGGSSDSYPSSNWDTAHATRARGRPGRIWNPTEGIPPPSSFPPIVRLD